MKPGVRRSMRLTGRVLLALLVTVVLGVVWFYLLLLTGLSDEMARFPDLLWQALNVVPPVLLLAGGVALALGKRAIALWCYGVSMMVVLIFLL